MTLLSLRAAWSGRVFGVTWSDARDGVDQVYFLAMDASGGPLLAEVPLSESVGDGSHFPGLVWGDGAFAVLWRDLGADALVFATVSTETFSPSAAVSLVGVDAATSRALAAPELAWGETVYGATWTVAASDGSLAGYFAVLAPDGSVLSGPERLDDDAGSYTTYPSLAWNGDDFVIAWIEAAWDDGPSSIWVVRRSREGLPVGAPLLLSTEPRPGSQALAVAGSELVLVWTTYVPSGGRNDLHYSRLGCP
jgi:hypothetical protein